MEKRKISPLPVFNPRSSSPSLYGLQTENVNKEQRAGKKKFPRRKENLNKKYDRNEYKDQRLIFEREVRM
jgi:hypothetical protein